MVEKNIFSELGIKDKEMIINFDIQAAVYIMTDLQNS